MEKKIENANRKCGCFVAYREIKTKKNFMKMPEWNRARFTLIAFSLVILVE